VELIIALADGKDSRHIRLLIARRAGDQAAFGVALVIAPQAAHRIMHGGKNLHRGVPRIDALEFFVNLQNAGEFAVQHFARELAHVEIDAGTVLLHAQPFLQADLEYFARGDIARHEVAVLRIAVFEKIVAFLLGDVVGRAGILRFAGHPNPTAFAARAFANQPQFVGSGNGRRMDLHELGIGVMHAGLEHSAHGAARAGHGIGRTAEQQSVAAAGENHDVAGDGVNFHRDHVLAHATAAAAFFVENRP
jgi:hypothetical protein